MNAPIYSNMKTSKGVMEEISFDSWKIIIDYLNDENIGDGFGSMLSYRSTSKTFSNTILECIKTVRIFVQSSSMKMLKIILSRPASLQKMIIILKGEIADKRLFYDLICGCKDLRLLTIRVECTTTLLGSEELQQVGNSCTKIEELYLKGSHHHKVTLKLPIFPTSFSGLQKFEIQKFYTTEPPDNMEDWVNLRSIGGDYLLNVTSWTENISILPNLKEIKITSDEMCDNNFINFCNLSNDKRICKTLEVFESSYTPEYMRVAVGITDDSLYSVINTFSNLKVITFENSHITLTRTDIIQKLAELNQLQVLQINGSKLFFDADISLIENWLQTALPHFPKSLEKIQFLDCAVSRDTYEEINQIVGLLSLFESIPSMIMSAFHNAIPNLREIHVTFSIGEDESSYGGSDDEDESDDGDMGEYRCDGARRHWGCDGKAHYFMEDEEDSE